MSEEWYKFYSVEDPSIYTYLYGTLGDAVDLCEIRNKTRHWGSSCKVCIVSDADVKKDRNGVFEDRDYWNITKRLEREQDRLILMQSKLKKSRQENDDDV